ncbi:MAG TPA: NB-ARC domain-containing protein [Ktedonobacterales bacterium]|jgi:tetratricopeptide (TPR) repeat protein/DNA-binding XRE family transcriptional regulator
MRKSIEPRPNLRLKAAREAKFLTQEALAEELKVSPVTIGRWERGVSFPGPYLREQLCRVIEKTPAELGLLDAAYPLVPDALDGPRAPGMVRPVAAAPPATPAHGLVGRDALLAVVKARLCSGPGVPRVALSGMPGVGKTAVAATIAHDPDIAERFPDGVLWAGLGPTPNVMGLLAEWGEAVGLTTAELARGDTMESRARAIRGALAKQRTLLVVDDAWDAAHALAFLLDAPGCAYLMTTRSGSVAALVAAEGALAVHELNEYDGFALLRLLAPELESHASVDAHALVRAVGGLPLALTLMGNYLRVETHTGQPRRIRSALANLGHASDRLRLAGPTAPSQRPPSLPLGAPLSLRAAIAVSDMALDADVSKTLHALAIFPSKPNTFAEDAALAVADCPPEALDSLCDVGLLESVAAGRYTLHQTIADYALPLLDNHGPHVRFAVFMVEYVDAHAGDYSALDDERENILAALASAAGQGARDHLLRGAVALAPYLEARGLYAAADNVLALAEQAAAGGGEEKLLARIDLHRARVAELSGAHARADTLYGEATAAAERAGDRETLCDLLTHRGELAYNHGDFTAAEQLLADALKLAHALADRRRSGSILRNLGEVSDARGDFPAGEQRYVRALNFARMAGDLETMSACLQDLGATAAKRGQFEEAERALTEGLEYARALGHPQRTSALLANLGVVAVYRGHLPVAKTYLLQSLEMARSIANPVRQVNALQNLGFLARYERAYDRAQEYLSEAMTGARSLDHRWLIAETLIECGELELARQRPAVANSVFAEALEVARDSSGHDMRELVAGGLFGLARVCLATGDIAGAREHGQESWRLYADLGLIAARDVSAWLGALPTAGAPRVGV